MSFVSVYSKRKDCYTYFIWNKNHQEKLKEDEISICFDFFHGPLKIRCNNNNNIFIREKNIHYSQNSKFCE